MQRSRSMAITGDSERGLDRKSTRLNSSHLVISYAVFCLKKKKISRGHVRFVSELYDVPVVFFFFFFNDTATTEIYTLSLHDALPILATNVSAPRSAKISW